MEIQFADDKIIGGIISPHMTNGDVGLKKNNISISVSDGSKDIVAIGQHIIMMEGINGD